MTDVRATGRSNTDASSGRTVDATREDADATATTIDRSPGRTSATLATSLAAAAVLLTPSAFVIVAGVPGTVLLGVGAARGSTTAIRYGTGLLVLGVAMTGVFVGGSPTLVGTTLLSILAWDAARYGIAVGEQLGREAATARIELAHTVASATVGVAGVGVAYGAFLLVANEGSLLALVALLVGATVLLVTLRRPTAG